MKWRKKRKTDNIKTKRTVMFELKHSIEAEDERSARVRCIKWCENDREIMDEVKEWIDPVEDYKAIQFCYIEEEEDA